MKSCEGCSSFTCLQHVYDASTCLRLLLFPGPASITASPPQTQAAPAPAPGRLGSKPYKYSCSRVLQPDLATKLIWVPPYMAVPCQDSEQRPACRSLWGLGPFRQSRYRHKFPESRTYNSVRVRHAVSCWESFARHCSCSGCTSGHERVA